MVTGTGTLPPVWPSKEPDGPRKVVSRIGFTYLKNPPLALVAALLFWAVFPSPASGQLTLVGGVAHTRDLGGQWGADIRVGVDPPGLPLGVFVGADYFLTSCTEDCGLRGFRAGAILRSSVPVIQPYFTGAYVVRDRKLGDESKRWMGPAVGAGLRVTAGIKIQAEATWEFFGDELNRWVFRVGLGLWG